MATITYKCNICDRDIDLLENSNGLTTFSKCVITYGCKGKLLKTKRNPDNIREKFPSEVAGLEDYSQRRVLFNYTQNLPNNVWVINHDLGTNPAITVYVNTNGKLGKLDPDQYEVLFVNKNQLRITFGNFFNGQAQLVSRSSIKLTPQMIPSDVPLFQVTSQGYFTFAVPKYLTKFQYPPSLLPTPTLPYNLDNTPIRIEVSIKKPNEEEELCTEFLSNSLSDVPWSGWNEVLVRRRRNYYLFSKGILDFRTLGGDTLKFTDIPTGTQLKITRIDYGTGVLQPIPPEGLYILLSNTPFTSNDKVKDKVIDVANMVDNDIDYFSYGTTDFLVDPTNVEKTYPDILQIKPVNFIPPSPSVTPTISPTISLTPTNTPTSSVVVSATANVSPTPTPTVTRSLTLTPSPTPSITPSSTPGSFNQPFDFALVRYTWNPNNGTDLDTRTAIVNPPRNVDVGWDRANDDGVYLTWGGDNTTPSGPEAVLVDFNSLATDNPDIDDLTIRLRLNWYGARIDGNVGVQFQSYLGGSMQHVGTDFINVGGVLVNDATIFVNCVSNSAGNVDGSDIGTLVYTPSDKTAQFFPLVPAVTPTPTPSITPTISLTPSITQTISVTPSITQTISLTPTISSTISVTPSATLPLVSTTPTISVTPSVTSSIPLTPTSTPTISVTPSITGTVLTSPTPTPSVTVTPNKVGPLLHFDGANASTAIIDSHGVSTWAVNGLAQISTSQSKFGGSSLAVNSGYVVTEDMGHSFLGDFCVEGWAFATATPRGIFHTNPISSASGLALGWDDDNNQWALYYNSSATNSGTTTIPTGWFHYAVYRVGNTLRAAINGTSVITVTSSSTDALGGYQTMYHGIYYNNGYPWVGYLDEFRVTFGSSPYQTANFTPPTTPFV